MTLIRIPPGWHLPEHAVTPETAYLNRRQMLRSIGGMGLGVVGLPAIAGCQLEERVYRFRCVEAWSMVLPWLGFPMRALLTQVEPTPAAKFVRFTAFYNPQLMGGLFASLYPWPYTEGLRLEEMANEVAFFAVGLYGKQLPKQHGAPLRMVLPWKYGFKGAKAIVKIEFVATEPKTFWHTVQPNEYSFLANVEPDVPHPRWSQKTERFISTGPGLSWEERPTLLYNGYANWVSDLYPR